MYTCIKFFFDTHEEDLVLENSTSCSKKTSPRQEHGNKQHQAYTPKNIGTNTTNTQDHTKVPLRKCMFFQTWRGRFFYNNRSGPCYPSCKTRRVVAEKPATPELSLLKSLPQQRVCIILAASSNSEFFCTRPTLLLIHLSICEILSRRSHDR